ncbi:MAG: OsmC family protein [Planctomycetota bacterium]
MVRIEIAYQGELRCEATHTPSSSTLVTDAPVDNHGKGQSFSPTDLVATALGSCMVTIMGIVAKRHDLDLRGTTVTVEKEMLAKPARRIGQLKVTIGLNRKYEPDQLRLLEKAAAGCPVMQSLHPEIEIPVEFVQGA